MASWSIIITYDNEVDRASALSDQLRARRVELGLTLAELARRADTSAATLSRYENGWTRFELSTLRKLATALGCELVVKLEPRMPNLDRPAAGEVVRRLRRLFWDQRLTVGHLTKNTLWVVERVLDLGNLDDVRGLIAYLGRDEFLGQVREARLTSPRTRAFWNRMLEKEGLTCTRRFSRDQASTSWRSSSR